MHLCIAFERNEGWKRCREGNIGRWGKEGAVRLRPITRSDLSRVRPG